MIMKQKTLKKLVLSGLIAALVFVTTAFFPLPLPGGGYANFGDCFVILAGLLLGPVYGSLAAVMGAALSDLILGYGIYIPATFIIKGLMALTVAIVAGRSGRSFRFWRIALSAALAEFAMVGGCLLFELFLYGGGAVSYRVYRYFFPLNRNRYRRDLYRRDTNPASPVGNTNPLVFGHLFAVGSE